MLAGARRLDRRVQRQDIGLERDLLDHVDDVDDLVGAGVDRLHGVDHARDRLPAPLRQPAGVAGQRIRFARIVGRLTHRAGQLLHARRSLFQRGRLLLGALRQIRVAHRDLPARRGDCIGAGAHLSHHAGETRFHARQHGQHAAGLVAALLPGQAAVTGSGRTMPLWRRIESPGRAQVPARDPLESPDRNIERTDDRSAQPPGKDSAECQTQHQQRQGPRAQLRIALLRILIDGLGRGGLQLVQFRIGRCERDIELRNGVEYQRHHTLAIARLQRGNHRLDPLLVQRLPARRHQLRGTVLLPPARQCQIGLPRRLRRARESGRGIGARQRIGRIGGERGLIEQHAHQQLVRARLGQVHRSGQLMLIDLPRGIVAAGHAKPAKGADDQQDQIGNDNQAPQSGANGGVAKHSSSPVFSCDRGMCAAPLSTACPGIP